MNREKVRILIPFFLVLAALSYCWWQLLSNQYIPHWKHYAALVLFVPVIFLAMKKTKKLLIPLGVFLFLAAFHIISLSFNRATFFIGENVPYVPHIQPLSLLLLIIYLGLNLDLLMDWKLDRDEQRLRRSGKVGH